MRFLIVLATVAVGFSCVPSGEAHLGGHGGRPNWSGKHRSKLACDKPFTSNTLALAPSSDALQGAHGAHTVVVTVHQYTTRTVGVPPSNSPPAKATTVDPVIASPHGPHIVTVTVSKHTTVGNSSPSSSSATSTTPLPVHRQAVTSTTTTSTPFTRQTTSTAPMVVTSRKVSTPPVSKPSPPSNGTCNGSLDDIQLYVNSHNAYRRTHGAADLTWNDTLAKTAQDWTNGCIYMHSGGAGENIADAPLPLSIPGVVEELWGKSEAGNFQKGMVINSETIHQVGHYTQIVWKDTQQLGCGCTVCNDTMAFVSCKYFPPGNWIGDFDKKVDEAKQ